MTPKPITINTLFYGDNLPILRDYIADKSIDLGTFKQAPKADQPGAVKPELGL
jgi:hypothetical protein